MTTTPASQDWNPAEYQRNAAFVSQYGEALVALAGDVSGLRVLDLGCGDGILTAQLAKLGADVVGVDSSAAMVDSARQKGVRAHVVDGQNLPFEQEFDLVFSNAALHWMKPPFPVAQGVFRALKPGGKFLAEMGGHMNMAAVVTAITAVIENAGFGCRGHNPWYFPTEKEHAELLTEAGFKVDDITRFNRMTPLPTDMRGWLATFAGPFFKECADERDRLVAEIEHLLAPALRDQSGNWTADYVRLRFTAIRPTA